MEHKTQALNPFLPSYEYIPDGEPHVFGDRVYLYGSHDRFNGRSFCLNDYVCWSADVYDLGNWRYEGVIFKRSQDPRGKSGALHALYAPDCCKGPDGRYYLYYFLAYSGIISVAVCDTPAGHFRYLGDVEYPDGTLLGGKGEPLQFDPGVFVDDDGRVYLYTGFGPVHYPKFLMGGHKATKHGAMGFELEVDMMTIRTGPVYIGVKGRKEGRGTPYEGHEFFEASSMRKFNGKYYFIYSSFQGHELCYAESDQPLGNFRYGGTLVSNGDIGFGGNAKARNFTGNTHGSLLKIGDRYFVFYHRQTNRNQFSRQACAEQITYENGAFRQARITSCGLNNGPLEGFGTYEARIASNLYSRKSGTYFYGVVKRPAGKYPYFTQTGGDREDRPDQYIANFTDGAVAVFRSFLMEGVSRIGVTVRGRGGGKMAAGICEEQMLGSVMIPQGSGERTVYMDVKIPDGEWPLYFTYQGRGKVDFISFTLLRK